MYEFILLYRLYILAEKLELCVLDDQFQLFRYDVPEIAYAI